MFSDFSSRSRPARRGRDLRRRRALSGRQTLSADGCAVRVDNPAFRFCAVWVLGAPGEWRSRCSGSLVWACSPARWVCSRSQPRGQQRAGSLGKLLDLIEQAASLIL